MICPVCNAFSHLEALCPYCGSAAEDEGRGSDWLGPYSPYEPGHTLGAENMFESEAFCQHAARCIRCHVPFTVDIPAVHA